MALGRIGTGVAELRKALKDKDQAVVREAITALGMIGPAAKDAIPTLEKLAEHADPQIAERAKAALRPVRGKSEQLLHVMAPLPSIQPE